MSAVWIAVLLVAALAAFGFLVYGIWRWPGVGYFCAAMAVLIAWEVPQIPQLVNLGGNSVYVLDVLAAAFLLVGISRTEQMRANLGPAVWIWLALGVLLCVSLLRGIPEFGLGAAMNEFRLFAYPVAALTWSMSLRRSEERPRAYMGRFAVLLGWGLVSVSALHMARTGLGSAAELVDAGSGTVQTTRPLVSGQALMLLMCAVICLWIWRAEARRWYLIHAAAFGLVVMIVQQRTVWGVAIMALFAVFLVAPGRTKATVIGGLLLAGALVPFLLTSQTGQSLAGQLLSSAENSSTYDARTVSWMNLILQSQANGDEAVIFGSPLGAGFGRLEGIDRWVTFAPHNWYLTLYLRVGLLGLTLFVAFILVTLVSAVKRRTDMASVAIIVMMIGYGWSYSWLWYSAVFAGWAYIRPTAVPSDRLSQAPLEADLRTPNRNKGLQGMQRRYSHKPQDS